MKMKYQKAKKLTKDYIISKQERKISIKVDWSQSQVM